MEACSLSMRMSAVVVVVRFQVGSVSDVLFLPYILNEKTKKQNCTESNRIEYRTLLIV